MGRDEAWFQIALFTVAFSAVAGCCFAQSLRVDSGVGREIQRPADVPPLPPAPLPESLSQAREKPSDAVRAAYSGPNGANPKPGQRRLKIPADLPGSEAPPIVLPPLAPGAPEAQRRSAIERLYEELPAIPGLPSAEKPPAGAPLMLDELEQMAAERSPLVYQAAADVEAARGVAIQVGTYFNPQVSYQADNVNTGRTAGYQGINISQTIATGGKLQLARAAACVDVENAELALRKVHYDLATQVRSNYFALLVAREKVKINRALVELADGVYRTQIARVKAGEAAPYEPLQLRVLAVQARAQLLQTDNDSQAAWRRLAATLNAPDMPPAEVAGRADAPVPQITHDEAANRIIESHTNLAIAQNSVTKSRLQVRLARITPWVPNIDTATVIQKDYTTPPFGTTVNIQAGIPLPLFDRNRGNIMAAEAGLLRARHDYDRARNELLTSLADIFSRYQTSSVTLGLYRSQILLDQVRAYRSIYERYQQQPDAVSFNDVVTAQQTLASTVAAYMQALGDQWQAAVDLAGLLQEDDLFAMGKGETASQRAVGSDW